MYMYMYSYPLYQIYTVIKKNIQLKVYHPTGGKWFIHGLKNQKNQLLSLEHSRFLSVAS